MKLFGYSISLNVVILICIFYLIMVVNALSGSCIREGMGTMTPIEIAMKLNDIQGKIFMQKKPMKEDTKNGFLDRFVKLKTEAQTEKSYPLIQSFIDKLKLPSSNQARAEAEIQKAYDDANVTAIVTP